MIICKPTSKYVTTLFPLFCFNLFSPSIDKWAELKAMEQIAADDAELAGEE